MSVKGAPRSLLLNTMWIYLQHGHRWQSCCARCYVTSPRNVFSRNTFSCHINSLVQDCSISLLMHWRYCSLALSHWYNVPDSKVHVANMGSTWVLSAPGGPHVGPMNLAIRDSIPGDLVTYNASQEVWTWFTFSWVLLWFIWKWLMIKETWKDAC